MAYGLAHYQAGWKQWDQAMHQAAHIKAPLLLGFGESDRRVPLALGKRLHDALRDAGRPPQWVAYGTKATAGAWRPGPDQQRDRLG